MIKTATTLTYTTETECKDSKPSVSLYLESAYIGTLWGTVEPPRKEFDIAHGIIRIRDQNNVLIAVLWDAQKLEATP